jgi:hypothetical protein
MSRLLVEANPICCGKSPDCMAGLLESATWGRLFGEGGRDHRPREKKAACICGSETTITPVWERRYGEAPTGNDETSGRETGPGANQTCLGENLLSENSVPRHHCRRHVRLKVSIVSIPHGSDLDRRSESGKQRTVTVSRGPIGCF